MKDTKTTREQFTGERAQAGQRIAELIAEPKELLDNEKAAEQAIREAREYAESIVATVREPLLVLDADLRVVSANRSFYLTFGVKPEETQGRFIYDLGNGQWDIPRLRELLEEILPGNTSFYDFEVDHNFPALGHRIMVLNARRIYSENRRTRLILLAIQDVTENIQSAGRLSVSEARYRRLFETAQDGILILDVETAEITDVNPFLIDMLGYSKEEFLGKRFWEIGPFKNIEASREAFRELQSKGYVRFEHLPLETKNGQQISVQFVSNVYSINGDRVIQCNIRDITERVQAEKELRNYKDQLEKKVEQRTAELEKANRKLQEDITERKKTEEELRKSEEKLRAMFESTGEGITFTDLEGKITDVNSATLRLHGFSHKKELIGRSAFELISDKDHNKAKENLIETLEKGYSGTIEYTLQTKDAKEFPAELSAALLRDKLGNPAAFVAITTDITERKLAEAEIRERERRYRLLAENIADVIWTAGIDSPTRLIYISPSVTRLLGYSVEEVMHKKMEEIFTADSFGSAMKVFVEEMAIEEKKQKELLRSRTLELELNHKDGFVVPVEVNFSFIRGPDRQPVEILAIARDITTRKRAEKQVKQLHEYLQLQVERMPIALIVWDKDFRVQSWNPSAEKMFGFTTEEALGKHPYDIIVPKEAQPHVDNIWRRLLEGDMTAYSINENITKDGRTIICEWSNTPLREADGTVVGVLSMVQDITERKRADEELKQSFENLRRTVDGAIQAIASIAETRDPYTAGHQRRVAKLAVAIAEELGLSKEQIETTYVAGILHDIGKVSVPAEILSKPGRLTEIEMSLIKGHPQVGREILKTLELPWAICPIVLQHHERMDGSGYPEGLSGKDILLQARILAVADVIEAMSSHRPYRPALGIDKALEEISQKKGTLYDSEVVDACLKFFNEKGFKFEEEIQAAIRSPLKIG